MSSDTHNASAPAPAASAALPRYPGGGAMMAVAGVVGIIGTGATIVAIMQDPQRGMMSYLLGFVVWFTISMGSLLMILSFRAAAARWVISVRRLIEVMATAVMLFALLIIPILVKMDALYSWVGHPAVAEGIIDRPQFRNAWLSPGFFTGRTVFYFILWIAASGLLLRWSQKQDDQPSDQMVKYQIRLGSGGMPIVFLTATFGIFDWVMSLEPGWGSTIFGAYILVGGYLASMGLTIILTHQFNRPGLLGGIVTETQLHNMGKLMFAAVCFWTYTAVSQYLLIWISNLPEENPFFIERMNGPWRPIFFSLIFFHFIVPFLALLPKRAKTHPQYVSAVAAFLIFMHVVDMSWVILPSKRGNFYTWSDFTAVIGIGGLYLAYVLFRLRDKQVAPKGDPDFVRLMAAAARHAAHPAH
jgi:hypothetical protein